MNTATKEDLEFLYSCKISLKDLKKYKEFLKK
jgi:hypothetical protein